MAQFRVIIPDELNEVAKEMAGKDKRSKNAYIEVALKEKIARDKKRFNKNKELN